MRHLIDPADFTLEETLSLMDLADRIHDDPAAYKDVAARKRLATLFYEPSTRTRLSFEAAMLNLGGQVLGFPDAGVSSASKGETVADTIRVISCVADIAAMRHPKEGAPLRASRYSRIPVINAGDGGHSHPTQTLLDMMTIRQRKGHLDHLTIGFCGDLKFGRTVHSLTAVACIDDGHPRIQGCTQGCALFGVAHRDDVGVVAYHFDGVFQRFALGRAGGFRVAETDDTCAETVGGGFKT